jgi:ABC-type uncharacterized transport system involved in gliding motility auxiliary subunit
VFFLPNPSGLLAGFQPDDKIYTMAARITGPAASAFGDSAPAAAHHEPEEGREPVEEPEHLSHSKGDINVIVVGDVDMLADDAWLSRQGSVFVPQNNNGDFVVNAMGNLAGGDELLSLRGRGVSQRSFTRLEDMQEEAERANLEHQKRLQDNLSNISEQITQIVSRASPDQGFVVPTEEEQAHISELIAQQADLRRDLNDVRENLYRDTNSLKNRLVLGNTLGVPALVALFALGVALIRWRRRREYKLLAGKAE